MLNLLDIVYEYQLLRFECADEETHISAGDHERFLGLSVLLEGELGADARRWCPRHTCVLAAQFTVPGGFETGEVRNLSGSGLALCAARPPSPGTRTVVRIAAPSQGIEFAFPAAVVWRAGKLKPMAGLAFDGRPSLSRFVPLPRGAWTKDVRFGEPPSMPTLA